MSTSIATRPRCHKPSTMHNYRLSQPRSTEKWKSGLVCVTRACSVEGRCCVTITKRNAWSSVWRYSDMQYLNNINPTSIFIRLHPTLSLSRMASRISKDSDTISETSTLASSTATTDFAPKTTAKHNNFIALQTLLETPELQATASSTNTSETLVESQAMIDKRNKRRTIYFTIGLTTFMSCAVLAAILVVIFGSTRVNQG